jgi:DNA-binding MarR family transcriptional regulator
MILPVEQIPNQDQERSERCGFLLGRVGKIASRQFAKALETVDMKPPEAAVLMNLRDRGPMTQQALGELLQIDPSNMVGVLNELEEAGFALRRRDRTDRRRHIVEISPAGVERVAVVADLVAGVEAQLLAVLDEQERDQLRALLARVVEAAAADDRPEVAPAEDRAGVAVPA